MMSEMLKVVVAPIVLVFAFAGTVAVVSKNRFDQETVQKLNDAHRMNVENLKAINESLDKTARLQVGPGALGTIERSERTVRMPDGGQAVLKFVTTTPPETATQRKVHSGYYFFDDLIPHNWDFEPTGDGGYIPGMICAAACDAGMPLTSTTLDPTTFDSTTTNRLSIRWNNGEYLWVDQDKRLNLTQDSRPLIASICLDAPECRSIVIRTADGGWDIYNRRGKKK